MRKFRIDVEEVPEFVYAVDITEAIQRAHEEIGVFEIMEYTCEICGQDIDVDLDGVKSCPKCGWLEE